MPYIVRLGPEYFPDASRNRPIRNGRIYIGQADTDPTETSNQQVVTALTEAGTEITLSQPILTSAGGVPIYNGSPVTLKVPAKYSLSVLNESGGLEYYVASNFGADDWEIEITASYLQADDGTPITINDSGFDCDLRVESVLNSCAFFMEASSSNFGFNTCDIEAWETGYTAIQIGGNASMTASTNAGNDKEFFLAQNGYYSATGWMYQNTDEASLYYQYSGNHTFYHAVSGTLDTAITWINLFQLKVDETIFNEDGKNVNYRIESSLNANSFYMDGASGNIGLDYAALDTWDSAYKAIQLKETGNLSSSDLTLNLSQNAFNNTGWYYQTASTASLYQQGLGAHAFYTATAGAAEAAISLIDLLLLSYTNTTFNEQGNDIDLRVESALNANAMFLDGASSNFGFNTNDVEGWDASMYAVQIGNAANIVSTATSVYITNNTYYDGSWRYRNGGNTAMQFFITDQFRFYYCDSGLEDAAISQIQLLNMSETEAVFNVGQNDINFQVNSDLQANAFYVDGASGNSAFNTDAIEAWNASYTALQIGTNASIYAETSSGSIVAMTQNTYFSAGSQWLRQDAGVSTLYHQINGNHEFYHGTTGSADTSVTFYNLLSLSSSGAVFNEGAEDIDLRVESDVNTHAFFIQGSDGAVSLGNSLSSTYTSTNVNLRLGMGTITSDVTPAINAHVYVSGNAELTSTGWEALTADNCAMFDIRGGNVKFYNASSPGVGGAPAWAEQFSVEWTTNEVIVDAAGTKGSGFRVGDTSTPKFLVDGTTGNIGIGNALSETLSTNYTHIKHDYGYISTRYDSGTPSNSAVTFLENIYINSSDVPTMVNSYAGSRYQQRYGYHLFDCCLYTVAGSPAPLVSVAQFSNNPTDGIIFDVIDSSINFRVGNSSNPRLYINGTTGHTALGIQPDSWSSNWRALQIGGNSSIFGNDTRGAAGGMYLAHNATENSGWTYISTDEATCLYQSSGNFTFLSATSGTAGNPVTWRELLELGYSQTIFNDGGAAVGFRVESAADAYNIFMEGTTGSVSFWGSPATVSSTINLFQIGNRYINDVKSGTGSYDAHNAVENSGWKYVANGPAIMSYYSDTGSKYWYTTASGTAGNPITWNEAFRIDNSGMIINAQQKDRDFTIEANSIANALFVDGSSGNIGFGNGSIEAWSSNFTSVQIGGNFNVFGNKTGGASNQGYISQNLYFDGTNFKYQDTDEGCMLQMTNGNHTFYVANSGTADANATLIESFRLRQTGAVFNLGEVDLDFTIAANGITSAFSVDGATGLISMLPTYSHDMNGETYRDLLINNSGELGYDSSTIRKKTNVVDMEDVSWLYDLRPVNFEYKRRDKVDGRYLNTGTGIKKYGMIAEEVESVNSDFVFYEEGLAEGIHYREFIPVLIKAIQDQQKEINYLKNRLLEVS